MTVFPGRKESYAAQILDAPGLTPQSARQNAGELVNKGIRGQQEVIAGLTDQTPVVTGEAARRILDGVPDDVGNMAAKEQLRKALGTELGGRKELSVEDILKLRQYLGDKSSYDAGQVGAAKRAARAGYDSVNQLLDATVEEAGGNVAVQGLANADRAIQAGNAVLKALPARSATLNLKRPWESAANLAQFAALKGQYGASKGMANWSPKAPAPMVVAAASQARASRALEMLGISMDSLRRPAPAVMLTQIQANPEQAVPALQFKEEKE
jgi:hypothetical protein